MHELSLCRQILGIIEDRVALEGFSMVSKIVIELGQLACVDKSTLSFCFEISSEDTKANRAKIEFLDIPGIAKCNYCDKNVRINHYADLCVHCDNILTDIISGEEMNIKSLEVQ